MFHMDSIAVKQGQRVQAGQTIGTVGSTGVSSGPHLHFEAWTQDGSVDPGLFIEEW